MLRQNRLGDCPLMFLGRLKSDVLQAVGMRVGLLRLERLLSVRLAFSFRQRFLRRGVRDQLKCSYWRLIFTCTFLVVAWWSVEAGVQILDIGGQIIDCDGRVDRPSHNFATILSIFIILFVFLCRL